MKTSWEGTPNSPVSARASSSAPAAASSSPSIIHTPACDTSTIAMPQRSPTSRKRASAVSWSERIAARSPSFSASCAEISGAAARTHGAGCSSASRMRSAAASRSPTSQDRTARKSTIGGQSTVSTPSRSASTWASTASSSPAAWSCASATAMTQRTKLRSAGSASPSGSSAIRIQSSPSAALPESTANHTSSLARCTARPASPVSARWRSAATTFSRSAVSRCSAPIWWPPRRRGACSSTTATKWCACAVADRVEHALLGQALDPVLADRLEHPVARRRRVDDLQERAVDQRGEEVEDLARASRRGRPTALCGVTPPGKTASRSASVRSASVEQVPAPVDDGAQRAVARQRGAAAAGEQPEAVVEPPGELLERQRAQPRGGQLDGQRQAVEPAADLDDGGDVRPSSTANPGAAAAPRSANSSHRRMRRAPRRRRRRGRAGQRRRPSISRSPTMPSGSRLVARTRTHGQRAEQFVRERRRRRRSGARSCRGRARAVRSASASRTRCIASRGAMPGAARSSSAASRRPSAARIAGADPAGLGDRGELDEPDPVGRLGQVAARRPRRPAGSCRPRPGRGA